MVFFFLRRLGHSIIVLIFVSIVIFALPRLIASPADVLLPPNATKADVQRLEKLWGLDKPLPVQYLTFARNAVTGDLGESRVFRNSATHVIAGRFPTTLKLAAAALLFILPLGIGGGIYAAVRHGRAADTGTRASALILQSMPSFWLGILLVNIFAVHLGWLPTSGSGSWQHYLLPAFALATFPLSALLRISRMSMLEVLDSDYIEFARAKGMPESRIIFKHALRNALITPLTYMGFTLAALLTGSVVIETVFAFPGVGSLAVQSIKSLDYSVAQALVLMFAAIYILANLLVDLLYGFVDPRITDRR